MALHRLTASPAALLKCFHTQYFNRLKVNHRRIRRSRNQKETVHLNPEPEPVTVVVIGLFLALAREAGTRLPRLWIFQLGLTPNVR